MKHQFLFLFFSLFFIKSLSAQSIQDKKADLFDAGTNLPKFINELDSTVRLHVLEDVNEIDINPNLTYYWFTLNKLHTTLGGYSGKLLNGQYQVVNKNNDLIEQGSFKYGLKNGQWVRWYKNGQIQSVTNWSNGLLDGITKNYNSNGRLFSVSEYKLGSLDGNSTIFKNDSTFIVIKYRKGVVVKRVTSK